MHRDDRLRSEEREDWRWRAWMRAHPARHHVYRTFIAVVGLIVVLIGLVLVPLPGPGWIIVFVGVAIWATEFVWASRLRTWGLGILSRWTDWILEQAWWVRALIALATALFVLIVVLVGLRSTGIPTWLPDRAHIVLAELLALLPW